MTLIEPPRTLRQAQQELTRTMLLDAAATLFRQQGYAGTTVEEIAAAIGATRATFYLHFATKSDLAIGFRDVIAGYDPDNADLLRIAARPTVGRLVEWLEGFTEHVDRRPGYLSGLHAAWRADPKVQELLDAHFETWVDGLAEGLARVRDCDPGHARLMATVLLRQLDVVDESWIRANWSERGHELREMLAVMWLGALRS